MAHDDIMPYASAEKHPLQHELFDKFLTHVPNNDPPFQGQDTLKAWQEKNHPWLELSDVHKETTENIRVTVIPFYMGCRETPASSVYWVSIKHKFGTKFHIFCIFVLFLYVLVALLYTLRKSWLIKRSIT